MLPWVPNARLLPTSSRSVARTVKTPAPTLGASPNSTRGLITPLVAAYLPGPDRRTCEAARFTRVAGSASGASENAPAYSRRLWRSVISTAPSNDIKPLARRPT
ncbi:hypothetical protein G6F68_018112 [Rhizopus microsporus]|nr:hypothetical protein G6F68_018112 [Rhizopus microsporus]